MKNKIFIASLLVLVIFNTFSFKSSYAADFEIPKYERAKKIVRGIGEKIGVRWTSGALDAVVGYLAGRVNTTDDQGNEHSPVVPSWWFFGTTPDTISISDKGDYSEYLLSGDDFKQGIIAIKDAVGNIKSGQDLMFAGDCISWKVQPDSNSGVLYWITDGIRVVSGSFGSPRYQGTAYTKTGSIINVLRNSANSSELIVNVSRDWHYSSSDDYRNTDIASFSLFNTGLLNLDSCKRSVVDSDIPVVTSITNNYFNNNVDYDPVYPINVSNGPANDNIDKPINDAVDPDDDSNPPADVDTPPDDKPEGSSWWEWLLKPLIAAIEAIGKAIEAIGNVVSTLIEAISDLFTKLFVPSADSITSMFDGVKSDFDKKLPFINQVSDFFNGVKSVSTAGETPTFKITLPPQYGGGTFNIIDFSYFDQYRTWILNFIRFTAWFAFLKRLYNRIPKMIY